MWKVLTAPVPAIILFLSLSASAQPTRDAHTITILKRVNETYRNMKSYQFEYKTVSDSKTEREGLTSTVYGPDIPNQPGQRHALPAGRQFHLGRN
jgi:hypothetical protein